MSTRGAIAVRTSPKSWLGIYNHFDSYPTGLGAAVWKEAKKKGVKTLSKALLKCGDWREYLSDGICEYCGKKAGQPHSIEGTIFGYSGEDYAGDREMKLKSKNVEELAVAIQSAFGGSFVEPVMARVNAERQWPIVQSFQKTGHPDPDCLYHKHGESKKDQMTEKTADALFIEWVYVLDPKRDFLEVWHHRVVEGKVRKSGISEYEIFKVTEVSLKKTEPDWAKIKKMASKMAGYDDE